MKVRIKFTKSGSMKFIGHLDLMRFFQKVMRRADIDIAYSAGYSPHQIMSFAAPLGVGVTSDGEYLDIEVHSSDSTERSLERLNAAVVEGITVTDYVALPDSAKNAMSVVSAADYRITVKEGYECPYTLESLKGSIKAFYEDRDEILIMKKTKKSEREINLKEFIYDMHEFDYEGTPAIFLKIATGSVTNIKPELVMKTFFEFLEAEYPEYGLALHRLDVYYTADDQTFVPLNKAGEVIA